MAKNHTSPNRSLRDNALRLLLVAIALVLGGSYSHWGSVAAQAPPTSWVCFPTCTEGDSRHLSIAGTGSGSLTGNEIFVGISSNPFSATIPISIFDGDSKGVTAGGRWDAGNSIVRLKFELFADPLGDLSGVSGTPLATWRGGNTGLAAVDAFGNTISMPDNAWFELTDPLNGNTAPFVNRPAAQSCPSCPYRYVLKASVDVSGVGTSNFKVRTAGVAVMKPRSFSFYGARTANDAAFVNATTYTGIWDFDFFVPPNTSSVTLFDGDLDFGSYNCATNDGDDPDSGAYPSFVTAAEQGGTPVFPEGNAVTTTPCASPGVGFTSGSPADDSSNSIFARSPISLPNIVYTVTDPNGVSYLNDNPSGNQEWEQFRLDTAPFVRSAMDHHITPEADGFVKSGVWKLRIEGQDLANLSGWRSQFETLARDPKGNPTPPDAFYTVGGHAFYDQGTIGQYDGDPALPGVQLALVDADDNITATTISDPTDGSYSFRVTEGTYTVRVIGPPAALYPTTQVGTYPDQPGLSVGGLTFSAEANFGFNDTEPTVTNPDAIDDGASTPYEVPVSIPVLANDLDPEGDVLTIVTFTQPPASQGTVSQVGDMLIFTPAAGFVGVSTFTYTITDGKGEDTANVTVTVGKKPVVVSIPPVVETYDGTPKGSTCTATDGLPATITYTGIAPTVYGPTKTAPTAVGTYASSCTVEGDPTHEGPTTSTSTVTINPRVVTVTASSHNVTYGDPVPSVTGSYAGFINGDTATTAALCSTAYTTTSLPGTTPATSCSGAAAPNYTFVYVDGSVTIGKLPVVVSIPPVNVPYDGTPKSATCSATDGLTGTITYTGIAPTVYGPTTTAPTNAGTYASSCTVPGDPTHEGPTTSKSTVTITPVIVTVTASSHTVTFGDPVPTITPSYSGFVGGDGPSVLTTAPACTTAYTTTSAAGTTPSTSCSGAAAANYTFVYVNGSVTINAAQVGDYRMTGGGTFGVATHGFELHCNAATGPNRLEVNWGKGDKFHLETLTAASCWTDPTIKSAPPAAPFNTYKGKGTGRYNGAPATAEWTFTDAGEPGTKDFATIVIRNASGTVVLSTSGNISKGNQQAHK